MIGAGQTTYRIESLSNTHERESFSCGVAELDRYLQQQITQDFKRRVTAPFVLVATPDPAVLGYYTLSSSALDLREYPPELAKKLPRYPVVPVTLLGRLAVHDQLRGQGMGEFLLMDALYRSLEATDNIGAVAVIVDAINEDAVRFYRHYGFLPLPEQPHRLLVPMRTIAEMFA